MLGQALAHEHPLMIARSAYGRPSSPLASPPNASCLLPASACRHVQRLDVLPGPHRVHPHLQPSKGCQRVRSSPPAENGFVLSARRPPGCCHVAAHLLCLLMHVLGSPRTLLLPPSAAVITDTLAPRRLCDASLFAATRFMWTLAAGRLALAPARTATGWRWSPLKRQAAAPASAGICGAGLPRQSCMAVCPACPRLWLHTRLRRHCGHSLPCLVGRSSASRCAPTAFPAERLGWEPFGLRPREWLLGCTSRRRRRAAAWPRGTLHRWSPGARSSRGLCCGGAASFKTTDDHRRPAPTPFANSSCARKLFLHASRSRQHKPLLVCHLLQILNPGSGRLEGCARRVPLLGV